MTLSGRTATALLVALVLSVCLNVFVAGLVVGRISSGNAGPTGEAGDGLQRFMATVPAEARPVIRRALRDNRRGLQDMVAAVREARRDAAVVAAREPFDPDALKTALAAVRARSEQLQAAVHGLIAEALDELSPEQRAEMAERWRGRQ